MAALVVLRSRHDREILRLAAPAFGALVAEPLFLLVDSAIVGRLGTAPLGGLGIAGQALATLANCFVFLAYGTTAAVARLVGAGNRMLAVDRGLDRLWCALAIGAVVAVVGWPFVPAIVGVFGASGQVARLADIYLRISLLGIPGLLVILAGVGVLRGLQDNRTPLMIAVAANTVNVLLNALFVFVFDWGIAGSAWGTVVAQNMGAAVYIGVVIRRARLLGASLRPSTAGLGAAAAASANLFARTMALRAALVMATVVAARGGDVHIAAHQLAFNLWRLFALAVDAIAIAGQSITGRYLGASDIANARAAARRMVEWGVACGIVLTVALLAARPWLPCLFTTDPAVRAELLAVLLLIAVTQPIAGVVFVLDGILIGAGDMRYLAIAGIIAMTVFMPLAYLVHILHGGLVALWAAIGVWMLARLATLAVRALGNAWVVTGAVRT